MASLRLAKILAQAGLTSRRAAEGLLAAGRVTINGVVRREPGAQADPERDRITLDGRALPARAPWHYVLLHKPRGVVTSRSDPGGRRVVVGLVDDAGARLFPVGRLDVESEGLLLLTNDGELANRLLHPRYEIPRVYEVEVEGHVARAELARWRRGVQLVDGLAVPRAVQWLHATPRTTWLTVTFSEGRNHEVRRYCRALGRRVVRLRRVAFGPLTLGSLAPGASRPLTAAELAALNRLRGDGKVAYNP